MTRTPAGARASCSRGRPCRSCRPPRRTGRAARRRNGSRSASSPPRRARAACRAPSSAAAPRSPRPRRDAGADPPPGRGRPGPRANRRLLPRGGRGGTFPWKASPSMVTVRDGPVAAGDGDDARHLSGQAPRRLLEIGLRPGLVQGSARSRLAQGLRGERPVAIAVRVRVGDDRESPGVCHVRRTLSRARRAASAPRARESADSAEHRKRGEALRRHRHAASPRRAARVLPLGEEAPAGGPRLLGQGACGDACQFRRDGQGKRHRFDEAASLHGPRNRTLWQTTFQAGDWLVLGEEQKGLPEEVLGRYPERWVRVPMIAEPSARSLNLSTCAGIALYEALRQAR